MPHADTHPDVSFIQTTLHPDGCRLQNAERMVRRMRVQSVLLVPVSVVIYKKCLKCFSLDSLIIFLNNSEKSIKVNNFGTQHPEETRHQKKKYKCTHLTYKLLPHYIEKYKTATSQLYSTLMLIKQLFFLQCSSF